MCSFLTLIKGLCGSVGDLHYLLCYSTQITFVLMQKQRCHPYCAVGLVFSLSLSFSLGLSISPSIFLSVSLSVSVYFSLATFNVAELKAEI